MRGSNSVATRFGNIPADEHHRRAVLGGRAAGCIAVKSGQLARITTTETCAKGGQTSGPANGQHNVKSGHMDRIRSSPLRLENLRPILAERNQRGGVATIGAAKFWKENPERATRRSQYAQHVRWHENAGRAPKSFCEFCSPELNENFRR